MFIIDCQLLFIANEENMNHLNERTPDPGDLSPDAHTAHVHAVKLFGVKETLLYDYTLACVSMC